MNSQRDLFISAVNQNHRLSNSLHNNQRNRNQQLLPQRAASTSCPDRNGRYPVTNQCDAYIECNNGVAEEKLCPEGLVYNPNAGFNYPCGYPIDVDCAGRPNLRKLSQYVFYVLYYQTQSIPKLILDLITDYPILKLILLNTWT